MLNDDVDLNELAKEIEDIEDIALPIVISGTSLSAIIELRAMDLWSSDDDERETDESGNPKGSIKQFVLQELESYGKMILDVVNKVREAEAE